MNLMKRVRILFNILLIILIIASSTAAYYYYKKYQTAQYALSNPEEAAQNDIKALTDSVGQLIELPSDEEPTVATVLDKDKLVDQPFFENSQNGDKVIIYTKAMKAILFRPEANKIIEVAPIEITQPVNTQNEEEEIEDVIQKPIEEPEPIVE